ncbi:MAG: hypothetical protein LBV50_10520 [Novosphingobium sp.]|jgi:hypothetical protein|nr:hypothetical protein [Novosphingobium sp.]
MRQFQPAPEPAPSSLRAWWAAVLLLALSVWTGTAGAAPAPGKGRYQVELVIAAPCFIGPCPDGRVKDRRTGEVFDAVVDFSRVGERPASRNDLIIEASRTRIKRPHGGPSYDAITITRIVRTAGEADWNAPPRPTGGRRF